jgi:uncharacterized protein (DUF924 family)
MAAYSIPLATDLVYWPISGDGNIVIWCSIDADLAELIEQPGKARIHQCAAEALDVVDLWRQAGSKRWFEKNADFDRTLRERFLTWHGAAAQGQLAAWVGTPVGALALVVLLLDQFPRNVSRGSPSMYATDATARDVAGAALDVGFDSQVDQPLQLFFYLSFAHSKDLADHDRAVQLNRPLGQESIAQAECHRDIIRRFGRYPQRNLILGRVMTPEEQRFLDEGGFSG